MKISKVLVSALVCSTITASSFKQAEALSVSKAIMIALGLTAAYGGYKAYAKKNPNAQENLNTINKIGSKAAGVAKYAAGKAIDLSQKAGATIYDNFVGNGSILGVLNCAFLGKNIKVLLNYLDDSIGKQFKQLGFTLLATGFEMAISISFTILMIVIFNATIDIRENLKITPNIYTGKPIYQSRQKISTNKENENLQNNNLENNNV